MATETATIRVARKTRDLLARQASERGLSVSALLSEIANDSVLEAAFRSERAATRADARSGAVRSEERDWETALDDGVD